MIAELTLTIATQMIGVTLSDPVMFSVPYEIGDTHFRSTTSWEVTEFDPSDKRPIGNEKTSETLTFVRLQANISRSKTSKQTLRRTVFCEQVPTFGRKYLYRVTVRGATAQEQRMLISNRRDAARIKVKSYQDETRYESPRIAITPSFIIEPGCEGLSGLAHVAKLTNETASSSIVSTSRNPTPQSVMRVHMFGYTGIQTTFSGELYFENGTSIDIEGTAFFPNANNLLFPYYSGAFEVETKSKSYLTAELKTSISPALLKLNPELRTDEYETN